MRTIAEFQYKQAIQGLIQNMEKVCAGSVANQKLTAYIRENVSKVVFMTAAQLASEVGLSQGSVSRFCMAMKYRGYNDFIEHLQNLIYKEMTLPGRFERVAHTDWKSSKSLFDSEQQNMQEVRTLVQTETYAQLVQHIVEAETVVLISARFSATILPYAYYMLSKIRDNVVQVTPDNPMWESIRVMQKSSTLILSYIYPRYSNQLLMKIKELRELEYSIFAVTDSDYLASKGLVGNYIRVPVTGGSMFDIYSAPILFTNLLVKDVAKHMKNVDKRIKQIEQAEEEQHVYFKEPEE